MHVLYLNPFDGGSHRACAEGWRSTSRHSLEIVGLPAYKWKWRMRHASITMARAVSQREKPFRPDVIFCTDMLNLPEFLGLAPPWVAQLPTVIYFHENQLTYPIQPPHQRDLHYAYTNLISAISANRVLFNSDFHLCEFTDAAEAWLNRMPDYQHLEIIDEIRQKAAVIPPGVRCLDISKISDDRESTSNRSPLRILWVSRWEFDKAPETFFAALRLLKQNSVKFSLSVLGESYRNAPACFDEARRDLADHIAHWGYLPSRADYDRVLCESDVVVSTARHEFFGIGILEAVAAGCFPLVPRRLAYVETLPDEPRFFYDGTVGELTEKLTALTNLRSQGNSLLSLDEAKSLTDGFRWESIARRLDDEISAVVRDGTTK